MCVCVRMDIHHVCMHYARMQACIRACMQKCMLANARMHACMHALLRQFDKRACMCANTNASRVYALCLHAGVHTCMKTWMHPCMHVCIHLHTCTHALLRPLGLHGRMYGCGQASGMHAFCTQTSMHSCPEQCKQICIYMHIFHGL